MAHTPPSEQTIDYLRHAFWSDPGEHAALADWIAQGKSAQDLFNAAASGMGAVILVDDPNVARPEHDVVTWVLTGTASEPANALEGDIIAAPGGDEVIANVDPILASGLSNNNGSNSITYYRIPQGAGTISKIALEIGTSSGNIAVAVYDNSGVGRAALPLNRIASSGIVACPASGFAEVALDAPVFVKPGDWLAIWADNTTATFRNAGGTAQLAANVLAGRACYEEGRTGGPPAVVDSAVNGFRRTIVLVGVA